MCAAALLTVLLCAYGLVARWSMIDTGMSRPEAANIFFRLYALHELPFLILAALFAGATLLAAVVSGRSDDTPKPIAPPGARSIALISLAVLLAGIATTHLVMHGLLFSMDEFTADFQARIFAKGEYAAAVPAPWSTIGPALTPIFVAFDARSGHWMSQYLPVYSLMKAPFVVAGLGWLLNPLLTAASVVVLAALTRRLWPGEGVRPWTAIALFVTSSEILVTSGSGYSMPAHLLLNLTWTWLYLRDDARSWGIALVIGAAALGLHNPFPHALFVAPFLLRLLRDRRWGRLGAAALVYGVAAAGWLAWFRFSSPLAQGDGGGLASVFALPGLSSVALHSINASLLATWHAPVLAILVLLALRSPRRLEPIWADLALGIGLTFGFYVFFTSAQGHGWGYRYMYQVLGSLCLLGACAVPAVISVLGEARTRVWLATAFGLALFAQLPMRLRDTERFVRPFAAGVEHVRTRDARIVVVHGHAIWYGRDLVRNDPYLRPPIVVRAASLVPGAVEAIKQAFPGHVMEISDEEFLRLGMTRWTPGR